MNKKYIYYLAIILLPISIFACKKKEASIEDILKDRLNEHLRITNEVFYERGKDSGKGTSIRLSAPLKTVIDKTGTRAITDTAIELYYANENRSTKTPLRIVWEFKNGKWSAEKVLPEDFEFILSFSQKTVDKMKGK